MATRLILAIVFVFHAAFAEEPAWVLLDEINAAKHAGGADNLTAILSYYPAEGKEHFLRFKKCSGLDQSFEPTPSTRCRKLSDAYIDVGSLFTSAKIQQVDAITWEVMIIILAFEVNILRVTRLKGVLDAALSRGGRIIQRTQGFLAGSASIAGDCAFGVLVDVSATHASIKHSVNLGQIQDIDRCQNTEDMIIRIDTYDRFEKSLVKVQKSTLTYTARAEYSEDCEDCIVIKAKSSFILNPNAWFPAFPLLWTGR